MFQNVARVRARLPGLSPPGRYRQSPLEAAPGSQRKGSAKVPPGRQQQGPLLAFRHWQPSPLLAPVTRTVSADGQLCSMFAVDIAGFNAAQRDDDIQMYIHGALYGMLETAFDRSQVPWRECVHEDRGDGVLIVIPPAISVADLVHPVPDKLLSLVRRHNRVSCDAARIQLRAAAHVGPVHYDGHGFVGHDVNLLHRMLDAPALKRMLAMSGAEIAFVTSSYVYDNVVVRRPSLVDPAAFRPLTIRVKETRARAWAYPLGGRNVDQAV